MLTLKDFSPEAYSSDSKMLNAAIQRCVGGTLTVPPLNPRTNLPVYMIDEPLLLPSDITVILDNCHLKLTPDAECNIFRNQNLYQKGYKTKAMEQKNIRIIGRGHALLDGEGHNDIFEWSSNKDGRPSVYVNNLILFHNVDGFELRGFELKDQRWWALNFLFCSNGVISDLIIRTNSRFSNQDGINLRVGCHHIKLKRISGTSGDDFIALSAIGLCTDYLVEGKSTDIAYIDIEDIIASSMHEGIVNLRANDTHKVHHINITNVVESNYDNENVMPSQTLLLGQAAFYAKEPGKHGCMHHIKVNGVYTKCAGAAITLGNTLVDSTIENLHVEGCINAITTKNYDHFGPARIVKRGLSDDPNYPDEGISMERVYIKDIYAKDLSGTVIDLENMRPYDFIRDCRVERVFYDGAQRIISCAEGKELPVV